MGKKDLRKNSEKPWLCSKCKILGKTPCKHLEKELPQIGFFKPYAYSNMDTFKGEETVSEDTRELEFRTNLYSFGLSDTYVDILTYRFFYELTFVEIAKLMKIETRQEAFYMYKQALAILKEKGYNV